MCSICWPVSILVGVALPQITEAGRPVDACEEEETNPLHDLLVFAISCTIVLLEVEVVWQGAVLCQD